MASTKRVRACLHGVGDPGLVGLVSFVFTLWGHKTKETYPTRPGSPTPCKQGLRLRTEGDQISFPTSDEDSIAFELNVLLNLTLPSYVL